MLTSACFRLPKQASSFEMSQQGAESSLQIWEPARRFEKAISFFVSLMFPKPRGLLASLSTME